MKDRGMTTMMIRRCLSAVALGAMLMGVTSCGGKKKQEEIDRLTDDLEVMEGELQAAQDRYDESDNDNEKLRDEINDLSKTVRGLESKLAVSKREVERFEKREAMAKEREARENAREPSRKEKLDVAKAAAEKQRAAVVKIVGDGSTGSGIVVKDGEKTWVYMAASVLMGNTKLEVKLEEGGTLTPSGVFEVAGDADLARLEVTDAVEVTAPLAEEGEIKSGLALLGVSDVGTLLEGRSYGAEGGILRVDSRFSQALPGSPVFHGETGALLALIVDAAEGSRVLWPREGGTSRDPKRVACRLDRKIAWTAMPIATFLEEAKVIADADRLTRLVETFASTRPSAEGVSMDATMGGGVTASDFLKDNKSVTAVGSLYELNEWLEEKGARAAPNDVKRRTESVYTGMGRTSGRHTATFTTKKFSPYHAKMAEQSLEWRRAAEKKLADLIKGLEH